MQWCINPAGRSYGDWHIKKDVFKIISKSHRTQHDIWYINMTVFSLHWFFSYKMRTDHLWEVTYPPYLLCCSCNCVQRTRIPGMTNNFGKCLLLRTLTSIPICYLDSHLDWSFPLCDFFFPSLIIFSASYITLLTLGIWPQRGKKHTLLLIL